MSEAAPRARSVPPPPDRVNRLAVWVALRVAGAVLGLSIVALAVFTDATLVRAVLVSGGLALAIGGVAYAAVAVRTSARLELARQTLRNARKRRFDGLEALAAGEQHDEIDALIQQVYRAGRALQSEIERLERVESYRRDFLGDVSHELRTPIFAVSGFAETLLDGALDDPAVRRRFVERIGANARRLQTLTQDLASISELETGRLTLTRRAVDLGELAGSVAEAVGMRADERGVRLAVRVPPGLPPVWADRDRLEQVLTNLAENAVKYNRPGGSVELIARRLPGGAVRVTVVDDGIGIPADALPRLTERFFRVDKSRARAEGGTGLGLAIVKHILEAHGVGLDVESRPEYGSTFAFTLPAATEAAEREATMAARRSALALGETGRSAVR